jgi:hypothetical protein
MMHPLLLMTTLSHRNKFCFTGGMIEGELVFVIDLITVASHRYFLVAVQLPGSSKKP